MTLEKAHELTAVHSGTGSGCDRNTTRMVLGGVMRDHCQEVIDSLIREYGLEKHWEIKPGTKLTSAFKS